MSVLSGILTSIAVLRRHYRRLKMIGALGSVTALGLIPLSLYGPRLDWVRYALLALVCFYTGRKVVQYVGARYALSQLLTEEQFVRCGVNSQHVRRCMKSDDHLWRKSFILQSLNALAARPAAETLLSDERRQRAGHFFQRSFREILPLRPTVDHLTLAGILILLTTSQLIPVDLTTLLFLAGFLSLALAAFCQIYQAVISAAVGSALDRLTRNLCDWTLRLSLDLVEEPQSGAYTHHLLYRSEPWFANAPPAVTGDGALREPDVRQSGSE